MPQPLEGGDFSVTLQLFSAFLGSFLAVLCLKKCVWEGKFVGNS